MIDFFAVLVLYKISLESSVTFQTLNRSLLHANLRITLLVYDNSPVKGDYLPIFEIDNITVYYVSDISNSGLSNAYNMAFKMATNLNKKYLLLLDQDSCFPLEYCKILLDSVIKFNNENLFVPLLVEEDKILSPCRFYLFKGFTWYPKENGIVKIAGKSLFNSGICIRLSAYSLTGGYSEMIPLDFSDHYFISQYKKRFSTFVLLPIKVCHSLSSFIMDKEKQLARFISYCNGTRMYTKFNNGSGFYYLLFWNSIRAIKLSFLFKDCTFICILFKEYLGYDIEAK